MGVEARWDDQRIAEFLASLDPDGLSALMRSTWTWDDRALRRDLSVLLVSLAVLAEFDRDAAEVSALPAAQAVRRRTMAQAADFLSGVLGPALTADVGGTGAASWVEAVLSAPPSPATPVCLADADADAVHAAFAHSTGGALPAPAGGKGAPLVPASYGGAASGIAGVLAVQRAMGHELDDSPFFGSAVLAAAALLASGDAAACRRHLPGIADGATVATLAATEAGGGWDPALIRARAQSGATGASTWTITGAKSHVPYGAAAQLLLVAARTTAGPSLFAVSAATDAVQVTPMSVLDATRPLAEITMTNAPAELIGRDGAAGRVLTHVLDIGSAALAAEQVGIAERCLELVSGWVAEAGPARRVALRRGQADMIVEIEFARAAARGPLRWSVDSTVPSTVEDRGAFGVAATAAHIACSRSSVFVARTAAAAASTVGEHAAIGPFLRRAISADLMFGGPAVTHERLLDRIGV